ncbi:MAG: hypothetical protein ACI9GM_000422 [Salibacteraceae bacterium]|jgi:hypothetical protein
MKNKFVLFVVAILISSILKSCKDDEKSKTCIDVKIEKNNCLRSVYSYLYNGSVVYLFENNGCPGNTNDLYSSNCQFICSPSGGLSGQGDGRCVDFDTIAIDRKLFWTK